MAMDLKRNTEGAGYGDGFEEKLLRILILSKLEKCQMN